MKRLAWVPLVVFMCVSPALWGQNTPNEDPSARLARLERQVESLRFAIEEAEQRTVELTFMLEAQEVARYEKIRYTSSADGRIISAHLWTPLKAAGRKLPALIWVHGGVHGHLDLYYWRLIRDMLEEGYIVLAPEYRGSTHHGAALYNAIDYGGMEVEDCISCLLYTSDAADE